MDIKIIKIEEAGADAWDKYVLNHPNSNMYQLSGWKNVIEKAYGHKTHYLAAVDRSDEKLLGILPMVHLKHFLFGNRLISMPYFDMGGILADNETIFETLFKEAIQIGKQIGVSELELRYTNDTKNMVASVHADSDFIKVKTDKVRMLLELSDSSDNLMKDFKSKLRSQIKKPIKEGLNFEIGGIELLDEFYAVFLINMRDLGSPVHSKKLLKYMLMEFSETTKIVLVKKDGISLAGSIISGYREVLENPWASSLRKYGHLSPNMLLYWAMLEYGCDNGFKYFDFGRSTPGEGTYNFKKQWGAEPELLQWYYCSNSKTEGPKGTEKSKFEKLIGYWQKLPVSVTGVVGPMIRKHIGL